MTRFVLLVFGFLIAGCSGAGSQLAPAPIAPFDMGVPDAVLLITGGTDARLEVCDCPSTQTDGLARRSGLVRSYRTAFGHTVLLDSGDFFFVDPAELRNKYILGAYRQAGYDFVCLGDQEWAMGSRLGGMLQSSGVEALSSNAGGVASKPCPCSRAIRRQWGNLKLAFVSELRPDAMRFFPRTELPPAVWPDNEVFKQVADLKREGWAVVLICHGDDADATDLAARSGADVIIRGHNTRTDDAARYVGKVPIVKVGGSETVGVLAMKFAAGGVIAVEFRAEPVDERWPVDHRLIDIFHEYVREYDKALGK